MTLLHVLATRFFRRMTRHANPRQPARGLFARYLLASVLILPMAQVQAAVFTVTSTADAGGATCGTPCTLRQAINAANADIFADTIQFAIPGAGPHVITPTTPLSTLVNTVTIDGYSQSGALANSSASGFNAVVKIQLSGAALPIGSFGLRAQSTFGSVSIRGLAITGFSGTGGGGSIGRAIVANSTGPVDVRGCSLGLTTSGTAAANHTGIEIAANQTGSVTIGSSGTSTVANRNVISGNSNFGVLIRTGTSTTIILNNLIGTNRGVTAALGNSSAGISVLRDYTTIRDNVIAGNGIGIILQAANFVVTGNKIGIAPDVVSGPVISNGTGIVLNPSSPLGQGIVGGLGSLQNLIAGNTGDGIEDFSGGLSVDFSQNRYFTNGGQAIDLRGSDGPTLNDPGDPDIGPNGLQNTPIISTATRDQPQNGSVPTTITGTLNSLPNRTFRITFYANAGNAGGQDNEGKYVGDAVADITTDANGNAAFGPIVENFAGLANIVTASATLIDVSTEKPIATSELASFVTVIQITPTLDLVVTSIADAGDGICDSTCTLREAIQAAELTPGPEIDRIRFAIQGNGPHTIALSSTLPFISRPLTIDGTTQPGAAANTDASGVGSNAILKIALVPAPGATFSPFTLITGADVTIRGLSISGFNVPIGASSQIFMQGANARVEGCWFGLRPDGSEALTSFALSMSGAGSQFGGTLPAQRNIWVNQLQVNAIGATVTNNLFGILPSGRAPAIVSVFTDQTNQNRAKALLVAGRTSRSLVQNNVFSTPPGAAAIELVDGADLFDNSFGESADGDSALPLGSALRVETNGVVLRSATHRIFGPIDTAVAFGVIPIADGVGQSIIEQAIVDGAARGVTIFSALSNVSIRSSISTPFGLGIDLLGGIEDGFGVTANDFDGTDNDAGANGAQNFPELQSAVRQGSQIRIDGVLHSLPNASFRISVCGVRAVPASGHGPCDRILDDLTIINSDGQGFADFSILANDFSGFSAVTATASLIVTPETVELTSEYALDIPIAQSDALFADGFD